MCEPQCELSEHLLNKSVRLFVVTAVATTVVWTYEHSYTVAIRRGWRIEYSATISGPVPVLRSLPTGGGV